MTKNPKRRTAAKASLPMVTGLVALLMVLLAAGVYLSNSRTPPPPQTAALEQVTIATNTEYVGTCPVIAARDRGYFANEGILAVVQSHSSGKSAMEAVLTGKANIGTVADIPIMFAGLNNQPVLVVATIFKAEKDHGIVARRDKGVNVPGSLKGKMIGVTLSTSGQFTLDAFLNRQKLRSDEVTMRNYKPEDLPAALQKGEIDAAATWEPFLATMMSNLGNNVVAFYGQDVYESIYNVAGMRDYVVSHPETIKKVLRALTVGAKFCSDSPDEARELISGTLKNDIVDLNLKASWPTYRFSVVLDQGLILALEDEARWAIKNKMTERADIPNYLNNIYLDDLEAITPSAVTIIH
jgi:NitT/TauT family transport system substrate-binding protein